MSKRVREEQIVVVAAPDLEAVVERLVQIAADVSASDGIACDAALVLARYESGQIAMADADGLIAVVGRSGRVPEVVKQAAAAAAGGGTMRRVALVAERRYQDETAADATARLSPPEGVDVVLFDQDLPLSPEVRAVVAAWITDGGGVAPMHDGRSISSEEGRAAILDEARQLSLEGRFDEAEACYLLAAARGDDPAAFLEYGAFQSRRGRLADAAESFQRAITYAEARQEWGVVARGCALLGLMRQTQGRLKEAAELQERAFDLAVRHGDEELVSKGRSRAGSLRKHAGDFFGAERLFRQSLRSERKGGRSLGVAAQYANLGLLARRRGDLAKAEEYLNRALGIALRSGTEDVVARQYGNLALVAKARGDLERAESLLRAAIEINQRLAIEHGLANDFSNLARVLERRGRLEEAKEMHERSLEIERKTGRVEGEARSLHSLGMIAAERGLTSEARSYLLEAQRLFQQLGLNDEAGLMTDLLEELSAGRTPRLVAGADGRVRRKRRR